MSFHSHAPLVVLLALISMSADVIAQQRPGSAVPAARQRPVVAANQQLRAPFNLTKAEQVQVDKILRAWEHKTSKIKKFSCKFERFEYQPQFTTGNKPHVTSDGVIHFKAPDRAEFQVTRRWDAEQVLETGDHLEHWICDGTMIYDYDSRQKLLREQKLPPEWQGKAITDGPLPFLFGAEANKIKARYWVRQIKAEQPGEIWLEIFPKTKQDAANYQRVLVMLAWANKQDDFLPNGMRVDRLGASYENYFFKDREINRARLLGGWWERGRYRARVPAGWQRVVDNGPAVAERPTNRSQNPAR